MLRSSVLTCSRIRFASAMALSAFLLIADASGAEPAPEDVPDDTIIVIGSRIILSADQVGSSVTLIDADEIEARKEPFALDLLRGVPGASVSRSGPIGGFTQLRLRGAEANQTLVLIDGVEVSDPISGEFDFMDLLTTDIERIEVVRGEQSALWGSEAIGGVVNIITRRGEGPPRLTAGFSYGSFDTRQFQGSASTGADDYSVLISGAFLESDGINVSRSGLETDGYRNGTLYFKGSVAPVKGFVFDVAARYVNAYNQEDSGFPQPADTDTQGRREQISARAQARYSALDGDWRHSLTASVNDVAANARDTDVLTTESHGRRFRLDYQSDFFFRPVFLPKTEHRLTLYAEREAMVFENSSIFVAGPPHRADTVNWGYVAEYGMAIGKAGYLTGAVRHDDNADFENALTFRATAAFKVTDATRLHGSMGTGVQNPGFFDLFGFDPGLFIGNPDLKPEQSFGWDAGVEQALFGDRLWIDLTWFRSRLDNEIVQIFLPPGPDLPGFPGGALTVENADLQGRRQGLEVSLKAQLTDRWNLTASYSYTDATENGAKEVRRPPHMAGMSTGVTFLDEKLHVNLSADYSGEFRDFDFSAFPAARVVLDSYLLVGLAARYRVNENAEFFLRGSNLLDQEYEEVLFFQTPGVAVTAGFAISAGIGK